MAEARLTPRRGSVVQHYGRGTHCWADVPDCRCVILVLLEGLSHNAGEGGVEVALVSSLRVLGVPRMSQEAGLH